MQSSRAMVYLALGANLGNRRENLAKALDRLRLGGKLRVSAVSGLYQTRPVGYANQPDFLNMVVKAETELAPLPLLVALKQIEADLGREATFRNGPRPIDIDIIFYNDLIFEDEQLQIPHPRLRGRGFVLAPLTELAPGYLHPGYSLTVENLLHELDLEQEGVELYTAEPPLVIPLPRFLFVTGQLAAPWLAEYLAEYGPKLGFEYQIVALEIEVAAFMTTRYITDHLKLTDEQRATLDLIIVPGFAKGDLAQLESITGIKIELGPTDLAELEAWLERRVGAAEHHHFYNETQLRGMQARLTDPNIRIYTDGQKIYAFNNQIFALGGPDDLEIRGIFRQLKIDNPSHAFYLGRELYKAALSVRLGKAYHQDRELEW